MIISGSEVADYLKCQQYWFDKYVLKLTPKGTISDPLAYGIYGHEWLYKFFNARSNGADIKEAIGEATSVISNLINNGEIDNNFALHLMSILYKYVEAYPDNNFKILGVERKFTARLDEDIEIGGTVDLIGQATAGKHEGKIVLLDHKFTLNFWSTDKLAMNNQLPKYMFIAKHNGYDVQLALINQLRYRKMGDNNEFFRRTPVAPSDNRISAIIDHHLSISHSIKRKKEEFKAGGTPDTPKIINGYYCENCPFFSLCDAELDGRSTETIKRAHFTVDTDSYLSTYKDL